MYSIAVADQQRSGLLSSSLHLASRLLQKSFLGTVAPGAEPCPALPALLSLPTAVRAG